jgi:2-iminobutanoate/2-iminopropanoate deaminase
MEPKFITHEPPRRYAKASVYGDLIFLAGEDSKNPKTQKIRGATVGEQAEYLFQNMRDTLESLGSSLANIIKLNVYIADASGADGYREARQKHLPHAPPGTLIMGVQLAESDMLIEIEAIAIIRNQ